MIDLNFMIYGRSMFLMNSDWEYYNRTLYCVHGYKECTLMIMEYCAFEKFGWKSNEAF